MKILVIETVESIGFHLVGKLFSNAILHDGHNQLKKERITQVGFEYLQIGASS